MHRRVWRPKAMAACAYVPHQKPSPRVLKKRPIRHSHGVAVQALVLWSEVLMGELAITFCLVFECDAEVALGWRREVVLAEGVVTLVVGLGWSACVVRCGDGGSSRIENRVVNRGHHCSLVFSAPHGCYFFNKVQK
eukprot:PhF_6_TR5004/c0_g1_i1/m.7083